MNRPRITTTTNAPLWVSCFVSEPTMSLMALLGKSQHGGQDPCMTPHKTSQESPLRVERPTELASLTTAVCPGDIPISCVSMERYQSAFEEQSHEGQCQGRRSEWVQIKTNRLRNSIGTRQSLSLKGKTVKYIPSNSVCVWHPLLITLAQCSLLKQTTHNSSLWAAVKERNSFWGLFKNRIKHDLYLGDKKQKSV